MARDGDRCRVILRGQLEQGVAVQKAIMHFVIEKGLKDEDTRQRARAQ